MYFVHLCLSPTILCACDLNGAFLHSASLTCASPLASPRPQPASREEEEEGRRLVAALVVRVPGLVPVAVHQCNFHLLHAVVRLSVWQSKVHQVGYVPGPLPVPEHLYPAASQGGWRQEEWVKLLILLYLTKGLKTAACPSSCRAAFLIMLLSKAVRYTSFIRLPLAGFFLRWSASLCFLPFCWNLWLWRKVRKSRRCCRVSNILHCVSRVG